MILIPPVQTALWLGAQQWAAHRWDSGRRSAALRVTGGVLLAVSAAGGVDALRRFLVKGTTWHPWTLGESTHLVTDGPNAISRNPMYAGMALGLVGTGLLTGRLWPGLAGVGLLATLTPQVRREEESLAATFGTQWDAYASRVRRWV